MSSTLEDVVVHRNISWHVVSVSVRLSSNAGMAAESWQVRSFALLRWPETILNPWILSLQCSTYFNMSSFNFALTKSRYVFTKQSETHRFRFLTRASTKGSGSSDFVGFDVVSNLCKAMRRTPETLQKLSPQMCSASPFRNKPISAVTLLNLWTHLHILTPLVALCASDCFPLTFADLKVFWTAAKQCVTVTRVPCRGGSSEFDRVFHVAPLSGESNNRRISTLDVTAPSMSWIIFQCDSEAMS